MNTVKININDKDIVSASGKTILDVINEFHLDNIPTLCYDKRLEHITSCFLCVVEVEGINKLIPSCSTYISDGMRIRTNSEKVRLSRKTALELLLSNHYADCIAPCTNNCPSNVDVQSYIALTSMGRYEEAIRLIKQNNPLPLSTGRVCVRNCEEACRRNLIDEPVAINCLKRFIADSDSTDKWMPEVKSKKNKSVAVIGGGPAGLTCAYYLAIEGYCVKIYEKMPMLGGMLRYGIPQFRLPNEILDSEINWILQVGSIQAETSCELGVDFSLDDLKEQGFDAIFIGVGASKASKLGLNGEDDTNGIYRGIDFLQEVSVNQQLKLKGSVIVVGGGNTAIDASRTALRCGADKVTIVYRRSINEMPAHHEEIEAAQAEGVEIKFLTNPKSLITEKNKITGIECLQMRLEEGKAGERPRPVPVDGSEFIITCDALISAIGQSVDSNFVSLDNQLKLNKWENIVINNDTFETSLPGIFAGGDSVTGPLTAIAAIAQGKKAAWSIINYLIDCNDKKSPNRFYSFKHNLATVTDREFDHCKKINQEKAYQISLSERINNFDEIDLGFSEIQSLNETKRCLECGCSEYADCNLRKYCDEYEIDITKFIGETKKYKIDDRHPFIVFDPNKCINCGKCVRTCSEILEVSALGFVNRGFKTIVRPSMEKALSETNCITCGNCIDVCPTGSITEKFPFKVLGTLEKENIETICNFCSVGCKVNFKKVSDNIYWVSNSTDEIIESHNNGYLCTKGRFGHRYLYQQNRQLNAVIKEKNKSLDVNIDEAIKHIAENLKKIIAEHGAESVAVMASPKLSNEELYLLQKFTRVGLKNNNINSFSNILNNYDLFELDNTLGFTASTATSDSLDKADVIVVINANLSDDALIMELKIKSAKKKGAKLILINSSELELTKYSDLWIDSKKGSNAILLHGVINHLIENDFVDKQFTENRIDNFDELKLKLGEYNDDAVINSTEIHQNKYEMLISYLQNPDSNIVFIYNIDSTKNRSHNELSAITNFLLLTGRINKANNGLIILREFNNSAGFMVMGAVPEYLPGFVKPDSKQEINRIADLWHSSLSDIFIPVDLNSKLRFGAIRALLVLGEDPLFIDKNRKLFNDIEFLVVSDFYKTNIMNEADVILPASAFIENDGTYTNCDHVVQKANRIVKSKIAYQNWEIISKLASCFSDQFEYKSINDIFKEISIVNRFYKHADSCKSIIDEFSNRYFQDGKFHLTGFDINMSDYDPFKPCLHYQENYYIANIKMQLI